MTQTSSTSYAKWANFPADCRTEEVSTILNWVRWGESGVVIGGSGMGKSNLAGYIATRPDVTSKYLPALPSRYLFIHCDFNALPHISTPYFYRLMLRKLQEAVANDEELKQRLNLIVTNIQSLDDIFALYMALQEAHELIILHADKHVIWLLDRFDEGCQRLEAETLNSLRSLRDRHKDRFSFIAFTRQPLTRLRDPAEYDELYELLVMHTCYMRLMNWRDGQWSAAQVMDRYETSLSPDAVQKLYKLCGGLPTFLRAAYTALATGDLDPDKSTDEWRKQIKTIPAFQRNCQEIWSSYTVAEQAALRTLALHPEQASIPTEIATFLEQMRVVQRGDENETLELFSPLFADFIRDQEQGEYGLVIRGNMVYGNGVTLSKSLAKQEFDLLSYLYEREDCVCEKIELFYHLWPDDQEHVNAEERLTALVRRLREKIELGGGHQFVENIRGRGYKFVQMKQA